MSKIAILRLSLALCFEILKAIKQAKKDDELEEINKNPNGWLTDHFGGVRNNKPETSKTDI